MGGLLLYRGQNRFLARFSPQLNRARERYAEFISIGINEPHRTEFHCGAGDSRVIGDDAFTAKVMAGRSNGGTPCKLEECIAIVCRFYELEPGELLKRGRMRKPSEARAVVA